MPATQEESIKIVVEVVDKFSKPLNDLKKELDGFSAKGGDGANKVKTGFDALSQSVKSVASSIGGALSPSLRALGITFTTLAATMGVAVNSLKNLAGNLDVLSRLSRETGLSVDKMREMEAVGRRLGISAGEMRAGFRGFAEAMHSVKLGTEVFGQLAERGLGAYAARLRGATTDAQRFDMALRELDRIHDPVHRREFLRIQQLPQGLADATGPERQKLIDEYRKTGGGPISKETIDKAKDFETSLWKLENTMEAMTTKLAESGGFKDLAATLDTVTTSAFKLSAALLEASKQVEDYGGPRSKEWHLPKGKEGDSWWDRFWQGMKSPRQGGGFRRVDPDHPAAETQSFLGGDENKQKDVIKVGTSEGVIDAMKKMQLDTGPGGPGGSTFGGANVIKASLGGGGNYGGGGNESEPAPAGGGKPFTGNKAQVASAAADEMRKGGLPEEAIAGILANVGEESGFNPTLRHPDQPHYGGEAHFAHGLYQEGGAEWNNYAKWLKQNHPGENWQDPRLQTQFLVWRMKTGYPKLWEKLKHLGRVGAANAFLHEYLKPAPGYQAQRDRQHQRGLPGVGHYTGEDVPPSASRPLPTAPGHGANVIHVRNELRDAVKGAGQFAKVEGAASVRIDLNGFPRGTRTASSSSGIFSDVELHRGNTLPVASESA